jgi:hypothetical protein
MIRTVLLVSALAACGDDGVHHLADAPPCTPTASTVEVTGPATYACQQPYMAKVSLTNNSCAPMTVSAVKLSAAVTSGQCGPSGAGMYQPKQAKLAAGETAVVLDLTGGTFCCLAPGCPATLQCDEAFTFEAVTNAGSFSGVESSHLSLDGCPTICP